MTIILKRGENFEKLMWPGVYHYFQQYGALPPFLARRYAREWLDAAVVPTEGTTLGALIDDLRQTAEECAWP